MKLTIIKCGRFKLDGGAMFGVVPKRMWQHLNQPDDNNMCSWSMNALLVATGVRKILIDTGMGNKQDEKFRAHFEPHGSENMIDSLAHVGVNPEAITDVFLTHLHFDHCGGALLRNEQSGQVEPAFPNAVYWTNQRHLNWAMNPNERERASYLKENFVPLLDAGRFQMIAVKQNIEFLPGFNLRFQYGHTEAMMTPIINAGKREVVYCADLLPSQWHVGMPYVMAYDVRPLQSMLEKGKLLEHAYKRRQILIVEHDPQIEAITIRKDERGRYVVDQTGTLAELLSQ